MRISGFSAGDAKEKGNGGRAGEFGGKRKGGEEGQRLMRTENVTGKSRLAGCHIGCMNELSRR